MSMIKISKEIFHEYLKGTVKTNNNKIKNNSISAGNLVNILFNSKNEIKYKINDDFLFK